MKTSAKKSSTTTSPSVIQAANQPFFARAGGGSFFAPVTHRATPAVQMQMAVNKPGDKFEQEADTMAGKVMRMPTPASPVQDEKLQRQDEEKVQRQADERPQRAVAPEEKVQRQDEEKTQASSATDEKLQRKGDGVPTVSAHTQASIHNKMAGGQALSADVRSHMERRFQADFSNVRVHNDPEAAKLSNQLSARAFTHQNHIFFAHDQYQPGTGEGKQLLAHELTHTLQQGAVARRKVDVSKVHAPQVQRGVFDSVKDTIKRGLNWAAERLIPGYTLLNVILGKNLITDEPVSRTGVNIIRGYMRLSPVVGSILLNELEETNTLVEAGAWVEAQVTRFGINFNGLANRLEAMWGEMSVWRSINYNVEIFKKYVSPVLGPFLAFSGVVIDKVKELRFEAALRLVGATQLLAAMKKDLAAFKRLVDDPKVILKYFINALKEGFSQFKDNFGTHFKNALFGWLFGKAAEMGIQIPKEFTAAGLFHLVAQLVGATYQQIRTQVVKKLGPRGESIVSTIEKTVDIVKDLVTRGPIALWERVKSFLSDLKEMIFSKISELVTIEIIKTAVLKLVSMLNPVGALVQLVLGIYRVVKFFIDKWETIKQLTNAILDSITNVALGNIAAAAGYIENTMAKGLTLVLSFLASIFGIGGIVEKVKALIKKIADPVQLAIGKVVGWIVEKGQGLLKKIGGAVLQAGVPQDPNERLRLAGKVAIAAARRLTGRVTSGLLMPALAVIKTRYGLTDIRPYEREGTWWVKSIINPTNDVNTGTSTASSPAEGAVKVKVISTKHPRTSAVPASKVPPLTTRTTPLHFEVNTTRAVQQATGLLLEPSGQFLTKEQGGNIVSIAGPPGFVRGPSGLLLPETPRLFGSVSGDRATRSREEPSLEVRAGDLRKPGMKRRPDALLLTPEQVEPLEFTLDVSLSKRGREHTPGSPTHKQMQIPGTITNILRTFPRTTPVVYTIYVSGQVPDETVTTLRGELNRLRQQNGWQDIDVTIRITPR